MGGVCCCSRANRVHDEDSAASASRPPTGSFLVFVNPKSGAGKGLKIFQNQVASRLDRHGIQYDLVVTSQAGQVEQAARERADLSRYSAVLILSGDGLIFELINGLSLRDDDFKLLRSLPVSVIPTGSGNGLLASVFSRRQMPLRNPAFLDAAIDVATSTSSVATPINIVHVQTQARNIAAFLSIGWGLMADIDIESERWRSTLGSQRFALGAVIRLMNLRVYRGRLSYLPYKQPKQPFTVPSFPIHPISAAQRMEGLAESACAPAALGSPDRPKDAEWQAQHLVEGVPPLEDALHGDDWVMIEDDFVLVYAMISSHISNEGDFMPTARPLDDRIHLGYVLRKDASKMGLLKFLTGIETSKHLDLPFFKVQEVSALRLEPLTRGSYLTVDGEVVQAPSIQATVTRLHSAVVSRPEVA